MVGDDDVLVEGKGAACHGPCGDVWRGQKLRHTPRKEDHYHQRGDPHKRFHLKRCLEDIDSCAKSVAPRDSCTICL